jgi:hypothetical protein
MDTRSGKEEESWKYQSGACKMMNLALLLSHKIATLSQAVQIHK